MNETSDTEQSTAETTDLKWEKLVEKRKNLREAYERVTTHIQSQALTGKETVHAILPYTFAMTDPMEVQLSKKDRVTVRLGIEQFKLLHHRGKPYVMVEVAKTGVAASAQPQKEQYVVSDNSDMFGLITPNKHLGDVSDDVGLERARYVGKVVKAITGLGK